MAKIEAICISREKGTQKSRVGSAKLIKNYGIEGDAHAGNWHRQVSLLSYDSARNFEDKGNIKIDDGAFGENILISGLDLSRLPLGTRIISGDVILALSQIGKECHHGCAIREEVGDCIMPREGVFTVVLQGGELKLGDEVKIEKPDFNFAILTVSDKASQGKRVDESGMYLKRRLIEEGFEFKEKLVVPDQMEDIKNQLINLSEKGINIILTTGGTGFSPRDITPEATEAVIEKRVPGIPEAMRQESAKYTSRAMLSRATAGIRKSSLIVNLPGSKKAVKENLDAFITELDHGLRILLEKESECGSISKKT